VIARTINKYEGFLNKLHIIVPTGRMVSGASAAISAAPTSMVLYLSIKGFLIAASPSSSILGS
jgi:hypothetical protein